MQNHEDIRLTALPPPPVHQKKQPAGGTDLNDSHKSNLNTQMPQAAASYLNSRPNQDKLEDGAYLNDAHRPKMSREKIPDVNELYLEVDHLPPSLQKTEKPTTAGKLFD